MAQMEPRQRVASAVGRTAPTLHFQTRMRIMDAGEGRPVPYTRSVREVEQRTGPWLKGQGPVLLPVRMRDRGHALFYFSQA
jgi:hypothetical protein